MWWDIGYDESFDVEVDHMLYGVGFTEDEVLADIFGNIYVESCYTYIDMSLGWRWGLVV